MTFFEVIATSGLGGALRMAVAALLMSSVLIIPIQISFSQSDPGDGAGKESSGSSNESGAEGTGTSESEVSDADSSESENADESDEPTSEDREETSPEQSESLEGGEQEQDPTDSSQEEDTAAGEESSSDPEQTAPEDSEDESASSEPSESHGSGNQTDAAPIATNQTGADPASSNQTNSESGIESSVAGSAQVGNVTSTEGQTANNQTNTEPDGQTGDSGQNSPEVYVEIREDGSGIAELEDGTPQVDFEGGSIYFGETIEQGGVLNMTVLEPEDLIASFPEETLEEMAIREQDGEFEVNVETGSDYTIEGQIVEIEFENVTLAQEEGITIALEYDDTGLSDEQSIRVLHFNHETLVWEVLQNNDDSFNGGEEVDSENNIVYGTTYSFSHFTPGSELDGPNPPVIDNPTSPTNDNTPTITGTKDTNTEVRLFDNKTDVFLGIAESDASTTWSITISSLIDGLHELVAVSANEIATATSEGVEIEIDTMSPVAPVITSPEDDAELGSSPNISGTQELIPFLFKWGSNGFDPGEFNSPQGIAHDLEGNYYTIESHRVQKFNSTGGFIDEWGSLGSGSGQFNSPLGIDVDSSGNVYVADSFNNRIQKFNSSGTFMIKWGRNGGDGSFGSQDGWFNSPRDIAVDSQGNVYVADGANHRIQKFYSNGTFITKWGSSGSGNGEFNQPSGIDIDSEDNVYVADTRNNRVQKFNSSGTFITKWGSSGIGDGQFKLPEDLAIDSEDNVVVADSDDFTSTPNHRVQKFDSNGTFITKWGSYGSGNSQFAFPAGIDVDSTNSILVVDTSNFRIQKFGQELGDLTVEVFDESVLLGTTSVESDGTWTFTPSPALGGGTHFVEARTIDEAGNAGSNSTLITFAIIPATPTITTPLQDMYTNDNLVGTIAGTADPNTFITVYKTDEVNQILGTALTDEEGFWIMPRHVLLESTSYEADTGFGLSIAIGDFNDDGFADVISGAPFADNSTEDAGEVGIFLGSASGIDTIADVILVGPLDDDFPDFGQAVAAGDVNGDGFDDAIVGADMVDDAAFGTGEVWIFHGSDTGVDSTVDTILSGPTNEDDRFGFAVASGDINDDGFDDVIAGAPNVDNGAFLDSGQVWIFHGSETGVDTNVDATLIGPDEDEASFGSALSVGNVNGDDYDDIIVGASGADSEMENVGMVQVFHGSESGAETTANVTLIGPIESDAFFGISVTAGDIDGDGRDDVIVGANLAGGETHPGEVLIFMGNDAGVDDVEDFTLTGISDFSNFGVGVAAGDINGDGLADVIVGATGIDFGEVRLYYSDEGSIADAADEVLKKSFPDPEFSGQIGSPVVAGDINGDGHDDIVTAGQSASTLVLFGGEVHVYFSPNFETLSDGERELFATAMDQDNNESSPSDGLPIIVDTELPTDPSIIFPDFETVDSPTIEFNWTDSTDNSELPVTYELLILELGSDIVVDHELDIPDSNLTLTVSLEDGDYDWLVRAIDAAGNPSAYSFFGGFTLNAVPPDAPIISSPLDGAVISDNLPLIEGTAEPFATVEVFDDFDEQVVSLGTTEADECGCWELAVPAELADGVHVFTATATDESDNESPASDETTVIVDTEAPPAPDLSSPVDNANTADDTPRLEWSEVVDATAVMYELLVDNDSDFSSPEESHSEIADPSFTLDPASDGTYFWKVRAIDEADNVGEFSDDFTFTIDTDGPISVEPATDMGPVDFALDQGELESIAAVEESALPNVESKPENVDFPFGFFSWTVTGLEPGGSVNMTLTYPVDVPAESSYWKVIDGEWVDASSLLGSNDGDEIVTLIISDGGFGDADGLENGEVSDPGGIGEGSGNMTIRVVELNSEPETLLGGSEFTISPDPFTLESESSLVVADNDINDSDPADGVIEMVDVGFATYTLVETTPPAGYERITTSTTVSVHPGNPAPIVTVENRAMGQEIEGETELPPPQLNEEEIDEFEDHGATVDGDPIDSADDLPPALIAPPEDADELNPDDVIYSEEADPDATGSDLFEDFGIPTYPAPDESIADEVVYSPPAFVIPKQDGSNFVLTPIIEEIFEDMTLLFLPPEETKVALASIQSVTIEFGEAGSDIGFSFDLSAEVPDDLPELDDAEETALFLDVDFVGDVDFSNSDSFASPPELVVLVSKQLEGETLPDGCPDITLYLLNELTDMWEEIDDPERNPDGDSMDECSYIIHTEHFSKFAIGSVKGSISTVSSRGPGAGDSSRSVYVDGTFEEEYFAVNPLARVSVAQAAFLTVSGQQESEFAIGETVEISTTIRNHQRDSQPYMFIVQIIDGNGITRSVSWSGGVLERAQTYTLSQSWLPEAAGDYQIRMFVWNGFEAPTPLSTVAAKSLRVSATGPTQSA